MERKFIDLCEKGDLIGAQAYYQLYSTTGISFNSVFCFVCYYGHLEVAQWLLLVCPTINISSDNYIAFKMACTKGHLHVAQWLLQVSKEKGQDINISSSNEYAFRLACFNGHLHVAQWLFKVSQERGECIDILADNDFAFRMACKNGHSEVKQWLDMEKRKIMTEKKHN
jgi:hypothetical protein